MKKRKIIPKKKFMQAAIKEAVKTKAKGDFAIGAVIVKDNKIIAKGGNRIKIDKDPTMHSEIVAIRNAAKKLGRKRLNDCILYSTHEPCPMCTSAAIWGSMKGIVYGATIKDMKKYGEKKGNKEWTWRTIPISTAKVLRKAKSRMGLVKKFMRDECKELFHA